MGNDRSNSERLNEDEARAVIRLWSQRQWEHHHWPTVADIAEGLDISAADAEALLRDVRGTHPARLGSLPLPVREGEEGGASSLIYAPLRFGEGDAKRREGFLRLAAGISGLTTVFCLFLERLL